MRVEVLRKAGIKPEQVKLVMNDTTLPNSGPSGGSRNNVMTGNSTRVACEMLLNAMKKPNGGYRTYAEMVAENIPVVYDGKWAAAACTACSSETGQGNPFAIYMYEVFMPEVEVDMETGEAKVVKFTTAADVGTIINRATVDGQIYGGLAQGIGLALTEDFDDLELHTTLARLRHPLSEGYPGRYGDPLSRNTASGWTVRRSRRRRSAADRAASGDPQRHLQCLRRAHLQSAGAGRGHQTATRCEAGSGPVGGRPRLAVAGARHCESRGASPPLAAVSVLAAVRYSKGLRA